MDDKHFIVMIGFAARARKIIIGLDNIELRHKNINTIVYDKSLSQNSVDRAKRIAQKYNIKIECIGEFICDVLKRPNVKIVGICL